MGFLHPDAAWRERLDALLAEIGPPGDALRAALREAAPDDLLAAHGRLFGHDPECPLELAFHLRDDPFQQARIMADIAGFYGAFGVEVDDGLRPDHLSACLEFVAYLHLKLAHAVAEGMDEAHAVTRDARDAFLAGFLRPGLAAWARQLEGGGGHGFYRQLAAWAEEAAREEEQS